MKLSRLAMGFEVWRGKASPAASVDVERARWMNTRGEVRGSRLPWRVLDMGQQRRRAAAHL
jgi:hypothetical protein